MRAGDCSSSGVWLSRESLEGLVVPGQLGQPGLSTEPSNAPKAGPVQALETVSEESGFVAPRPCRHVRRWPCSTVGRVVFSVNGPVGWMSVWNGRILTLCHT